MIIASAEPTDYVVAIWLVMGLLVSVLLLICALYLWRPKRYRQVVPHLSISVLLLCGLITYLGWQDGRGRDRIDAEQILQVVCGEGYRAVNLPVEGVGLVGMVDGAAVRFTYTRYSGTVAVEQRNELYLPHTTDIRIDLVSMDVQTADRQFWQVASEPRWQGSYLIRLDEHHRQVALPEISCKGYDDATAFQLTAVTQKRFDDLMDDLRGGGHDALKLLPLDELMQRGEKVYLRRCAACHGTAGQGNAVVPSLKGNRIVLGPLVNHINTVLWGRRKTGMKPFYNQLDFVELAAVMTYQRNVWGSRRNDRVQPSIVAAEILSSPRQRQRF